MMTVRVVAMRRTMFGGSLDDDLWWGSWLTHVRSLRVVRVTDRSRSQCSWVDRRRSAILRLIEDWEWRGWRSSRVASASPTLVFVPTSCTSTRRNRFICLTHSIEIIVLNIGAGTKGDTEDIVMGLGVIHPSCNSVLCFEVTLVSGGRVVVFSHNS